MSDESDDVEEVATVEIEVEEGPVSIDGETHRAGDVVTVELPSTLVTDLEAVTLRDRDVEVAPHVECRECGAAIPVPPALSAEQMRVMGFDVCAACEAGV